MTFKDLGLSQEILDALDKLGFETPTEIQQQAIPFLLNNPQKDLIALAQTGTGKTATFSLPLIQQIDVNNRAVQVLILCPTRELCLQIAKDIESYTSTNQRIKTLAVYGGAPISTQKRQLKQGVQIVVGTPGRTLDLIRQKSLDVSSIKWLVLDEADEMLNMGFKEDLKSILKDTPKDKQNLLFSATMPSAMKSIVRDFMTEPHQIQVAKQNVGATNVEHQYVVCQAKNRYLALQRLVDANSNIYGIIFCRTKRETQDVADRLIQMGYNADTIHGDLSQNQRDSVMKKFKNGTVQLLVATDVAARGIDVDNLTHVINYQLPDDPEVYVHRSGRTGRAGKSGVSMSILHSREMNKLRDIEKMVGKEFIHKQIPTGEEICRVQIQHFLQQIKDHQPNSNLIDEYWPIIEEEIGSLSSDEVINRLLSIEISRFLTEYQNAPDLNAGFSKPGKDSGKSTERGGGRGNKANVDWAGYELNTGSKQNMNPKRLIALINEQTDSNDINIGDIIVKNQFTYFEIDKNQSNRVEEAFEHLEFEGKPALSKAGRKPEPTQRSKRGGGNGNSSRGQQGERAGRNKRSRGNTETSNYSGGNGRKNRRRR